MARVVLQRVFWLEQQAGWTSFPFIPRDDITIDRLSVNVTTPIAAALAKVVRYAADATGRPAWLILKTGNLDFSTVGLKDATINHPPQPARTAGFLLPQLGRKSDPMTTDQTDAMRLIQSGLNRLGHSPGTAWMANGACGPPSP